MRTRYPILTVTALMLRLVLQPTPVAARLDISNRLPAQRDGGSSSSGSSGSGGTSGGNTANASCGFEPGQCFGAVGIACQGAMPTEAEVERVFALLAEGGEVRMPLTTTFWSPRFGMLSDRFGVGWMVTVTESPR